MIVFITKNDVINIQFNHAFKSIADENQKKICKELFCQFKPSHKSKVLVYSL